MDHIVHGVAKNQTRLSDYHFPLREKLALIGINGKLINYNLYLSHLL